MKPMGKTAVFGITLVRPESLFAQGSSGAPSLQRRILANDTIHFMILHDLCAASWNLNAWTYNDLQ